MMYKEFYIQVSVVYEEFYIQIIGWTIPHYKLICVCFSYRLELNGHRRRLTWEAAPRSIHDGIQSAIASSDCLVFDTNIAQLFADHGNLGINVTITVCDR